jgi:N utilization substance protein B
MTTRRDARERALGLAYEMDMRSVSTDVVLRELIDDLDVGRAARARDGEAIDTLILETPTVIDPYTLELVRGVGDDTPGLDALLDRYSERWAVDRMPVIDRALLRIACFELRDGDLPAGVVIGEAVDLAKQYSTKDSGRFINGLLARIEEVRGHANVATPEAES